MPDILHRISIDAPPQRVYDLIASTPSGIARSVEPAAARRRRTNGSSFSVYFGDAEQPAAVMQVLTDTQRTRGFGGSPTTPGPGSAPGSPHPPTQRPRRHRASVARAGWQRQAK